MADQNLRDLITDFQNLAESEHHGFIENIVSRTENAVTIFASLSLFEDKSKPHELLQPLCDLLFTIYRIGKNGASEYRNFTIQYLPNLIYLYLQNYSEKHGYRCLETLLISIHNIEMGDTEHARKSFKIPSIGTSSIYHDATLISESRIFAMPDSGVERGSVTHVAARTDKSPGGGQQPVAHINAQNRAKVVTQLFSVFSHLLGSSAHTFLEWSCKVSTRMVKRGFDHDKIRPELRASRPIVSRIFLPSSVYLDMLNLAYFAIYNNFGSEGMKLARAIEHRAKYECVPAVVLVSRAVAQLAASSGGNLEEAPALTVATPSVLTKNMITNASFRTKKLEGDIPRVENDEDANLAAEKMGIIAEEAEADVERMNKMNLKEGQDALDGEGKVKIGEKFKAKIENVRLPIRKKDKEKDKDKERGVSESSDKDNELVVKVKPDKKEKKNKEKKDKNLTVDQEHSSDDFIRMSALPGPGSGPGADTVTVHSPESGSTSIF